MNDDHRREKPIFLIKIVQSGEEVEIPLILKNLQRHFKEFYNNILKELKLKQKDVYITNEEGKMIGIADLNSSLEDIITKFGTRLKLYSEKVF
ncbi:MAG: hypothetical protein ACFE9I_11255 [Candidatus Hermodarchaeota archaeon]